MKTLLLVIMVSACEGTSITNVELQQDRSDAGNQESTGGGISVTVEAGSSSVRGGGAGYRSSSAVDTGGNQSTGGSSAVVSATGGDGMVRATGGSSSLTTGGSAATNSNASTGGMVQGTGGQMATGGSKANVGTGGSGTGGSKSSTGGAFVSTGGVQACVPKTFQLNVDCNTSSFCDDGCGHQVSCGITCPTGQQCQGGGKDKCGSCTKMVTTYVPGSCTVYTPYPQGCTFLSCSDTTKSLYDCSSGSAVSGTPAIVNGGLSTSLPTYQCY